MIPQRRSLTYTEQIMKKTYTHPVVAAAGPVVQHTQSGIVFGNELAQPLTKFRMP